MNFRPAVCWLLTAFSYTAQAQVGIGTSNPDQGAALDISSPGKALIVPRLTNNAISQIGTEGMIAYNVNTYSLENFTGSVPVAATSYTNTQAYTNYQGNGEQVGQSFRPPSPFTLEDFSAYLVSSGTEATYRLRIYTGSGITGTLLATSAPVVVPATGANGFFDFDFSANNLLLLSTQTYTFSFFANPGGSAIFRVSNQDPFPGGQLFSGNSVVPFNDMLFNVRRKGAMNWSPLINGYNAQTIGGEKTFTAAVSTPAVVTPATGTANMLAAAYGVVVSGGTAISTSNNCSVSRTGTGQYLVTFTGNVLAGQNIGNLPVGVTMYGSAPGQVTFQGTGAATGAMMVYTFNSGGVAADRGFSFAVYKP